MIGLEPQGVGVRNTIRHEYNEFCMLRGRILPDLELNQMASGLSHLGPAVSGIQ